MRASFITFATNGVCCLTFAECWLSAKRCLFLIFSPSCVIFTFLSCVFTNRSFLLDFCWARLNFVYVLASLQVTIC